MGGGSLNQALLILVGLLHTVTLQHKMKKFYEDKSRKSTRC